MTISEESGANPVVSRGAVRRTKRRHRRRQLLTLLIAMCVAVVGVGAYMMEANATTAPQISAVFSPPLTSAPAPVVPKVPWAKTTEGAVSVPDLSTLMVGPTQRQVPIASLTKMMSALLILDAYPLTATSSGPTIAITKTQMADYSYVIATGGSNAPVKLGEKLTERQMLQAMLVHSANNFALDWARIVAGSIPKFVAEMNAERDRLKMTATHYADPSGIDPSNRSTPHDQLIVAAKLMAIPFVQATVRLTSVTIPYAGTLVSYTPLVGWPNVVGVKSGYTSLAGACDVMAYESADKSRPVLILSAVTGQQGAQALYHSGLQARAQAIALDQTLRTVTVATSTPVGTVGTPGDMVTVQTNHPLTIATDGKAPLSWTWSIVLPTTSTPSGSVIGTATLHSGNLAATSTVVIASELKPQS